MDASYKMKARLILSDREKLKDMKASLKKAEAELEKTKEKLALE